jgi:16S rRNA (guanine1207-N2)-methyltransferase
MLPKNPQTLKQDIVFPANLRGHNLDFHSTWGLFSPTEIDEGSRMLIEEIDVKPADDTLEIGCGYGPIGLTIAKLSPQGRVHLLDKDFVAIDYTRKNAEINGIKNCDIYLSNAFSAVPEDQKFDNIVSNLPAKVGKELLYIILTDAKSHLKPGGKIVVVVISGLKEYIKRNFQEVFGNYEKLKQGKTYLVAQATKQ